MKKIPAWFIGECFGTFLLVFFGCGSVSAAVTTGAQVGVFQVAIVWGLGIATAIYMTGSLSGAHLNPAVTVSMAVWSDFPKRRVAPYCVAQFCGAFAAAAVLYFIFGGALQTYEQAHQIIRGQPGSEASAMVFGEFFPNPGGLPLTAAAHDRMEHLAAFGAEVIGTALLLLVIFCTTDARNKARPQLLTALTIGLTVTLLISLLGPLTMACFNPARDLAPRLFSVLAGWGAVPFRVNGLGWLTVYIIAPLLGGVLGGGLYKLFFKPGYARQGQEEALMSKARFILVGGFLGAGKTTAILKLAEHFKAQGLRVGLITNDQAGGLVDTARARAAQWPVEEIAGGCFCCRFPSLVEASQKLAASAHPDVFLAEPVGSCTDLVATVAFPLRQLYGADWRIAPFSVVVDPVRAARVLGLEAGAQFSEKVVYIYRKQLEEADIIVLNKCDLLDDARRTALRAALQASYPRAEIFECSAQTGAGLARWFTRLTTAEISPHAAMDVDYQVYGQGEALMGWLNATLRVSAPAPFDGNRLLTDLAARLRAQLQRAAAEVAHLKMTLAPGADALAMGAVSVVRNDQQPELTHTLLDLLAGGELTVNLRAEAAPELLEQVVRRIAAGWLGITLDVTKLESFRPGQPNPTHRIAKLE